MHLSTDIGPEAFATAVVIEARNAAEGVAAEYEHIDRAMAAAGLDGCEILSQRLYLREGRAYDAVYVRPLDGDEPLREESPLVFVFDITGFYGKI